MKKDAAIAELKGERDRVKDELFNLRKETSILICELMDADNGIRLCENRLSVIEYEIGQLG